MIIKPQAGKQEQFLSSEADIVLYGGSAGGGKTYGLLLEAGRNVAVKDFNAVIFRNSLTQIVKAGGLWDTAMGIYPQWGGRGVRHNTIFFWDAFQSKIDFAYLARDEEVKDWQGSQIDLICFDELTHFSRYQFFYMLSRLRSKSGVKPYVRATCNPDPDSWVRKFIAWWIGADGFAIEERCGVIRYFVNQNDQTHWFASREEAELAFPSIPPKSFTFINSSVYDNKILMDVDPNYIANLQALPKVERERLLSGNWDVTAGAGDYFQKTMFETVDAAPPFVKTVRCWDFAATPVSAVNPDPDWTVGMRASLTSDGVVYITDMVRERYNPADVKTLFVNTTKQDGVRVYSHIPEDPGSAGKVVAADYIKAVMGFSCKATRATGDKETRAKPASAQAAINNIKIVRGNWNDVFLSETEGFPLAAHDDIVDTLSDCITQLVGQISYNYKSML